MAKQGTPMAMPKLRFPEFRHASEWTTVQLRKFSEFVTERVGSTHCVPYTVTSGVGLVSQQEKLGRTIAGNSLKDYIVLQRNDFAYNKSATKIFPQGFVARYVGDDRAAVPNSIFACFRTSDNVVDPTYLDNLFATNLHGRWLRSRIAIGARAHGSLNVSDEDLMDLPVPLPGGPSSLGEQRKIAACLTSLDEVVAAQWRKVEALKTHKRGLMQQLFPGEGETLPRLRFPGFENAPEWKSKMIGEIASISSGTTPLRSNPEFYEDGHIPWVKTTDLNNSFIGATQERLTSKAKVVINPVGSVVVAMYGGFNQIGRTGLLKIAAATNQALSVLRVREEIVLPIYLLTWLNAKVENWKRIASSSRKDPNITSVDVAQFPICVPMLAEQQHVADCFFHLDAQIAAESDRLAMLKTHKRGLMQQLLPASEGG